MLKSPPSLSSGRPRRWSKGAPPKYETPGPWVVVVEAADGEGVTAYPPPKGPKGAANGKASTDKYAAEEDASEAPKPPVMAYDTAALRGNALASVVCVLAAIGVIPIAIKSPRVPFRSTLPLCVLLYSLAVASAVLLLYRRLPVVIAQDVGLDERMLASELVVHLVPVLYVPVMWTQSRAIYLRTLYVSKMKHMIQSVSVEGGRRDAKLRLLYGVATLVLVALAVLAVLFAYQVVRELNLTLVHLPALVYAVVIHILLWWNMVVQLLQLLILAGTLHARFHQLLVPGELTAASVRACRSMWLELRDVLGFDDDSTINGVYVANLLYLLVQCTMTAFETFSYQASGNFWACVGHGVFCGAYLVEMCVVYDCAHRVVTKMTSPFITTLDTLSMGELDQETYNEVAFFYSAIIANPPNYSIRGYASMDRPTLATIIITILSYIIFLTQYRADNEDTE